MSRRLLLALALCLFSAGGWAAGRIEMGVTVFASAPVCATSGAALRIAKLEATDGIPAAIEAFKAADECAFFRGTPITPVKIIARFTTQDGRTIKVMEATIEGVTVYAWADAPVKGEYDV